MLYSIQHEEDREEAMNLKKPLNQQRGFSGMSTHPAAKLAIMKRKGELNRLLRTLKEK